MKYNINNNIKLLLDKIFKNYFSLLIQMFWIFSFSCIQIKNISI